MSAIRTLYKPSINIALNTSTACQWTVGVHYILVCYLLRYYFTVILPNAYSSYSDFTNLPFLPFYSTAIPFSNGINYTVPSFLTIRVHLHNSTIAFKYGDEEYLLNNSIFPVE